MNEKSDEKFNFPKTNFRRKKKNILGIVETAKNTFDKSVSSFFHRNES